MDDLILVVRARLDERESQARAVLDAWVVADVQSKRRIAFLAEGLPKLTASTDLFDNHRDAWAEVLKQLALPYAIHPDYREEWRP